MLTVAAPLLPRAAGSSPNTLLGQKHTPSFPPYLECTKGLSPKNTAEQFLVKNHKRVIYFEHSDPEQKVLPSWYLPIMHTSNLIRSSTYPSFVMLTRFEKCTLCSLRNLATILLWPRGGGGGTQYIHYKSATSHCSGEQ